ncbi:MAG TPA: hypothetical protein VHE99_04365 [Gammaproteobacteria bacterium]|nr:hypothetical protein [Gammaproteobacteria bacterium]
MQEKDFKTNLDEKYFGKWVPVKLSETKGTPPLAPSSSTNESSLTIDTEDKNPKLITVDEDEEERFNPKLGT